MRAAVAILSLTVGLLGSAKRVQPDAVTIDNEPSMAIGAKVPALARKIDPLKCMGNWYVQVAIPTPFDRGAHNGLEEYSWDEEKQQVNVKYSWNQGSFEGKQSVITQKGRVHPESKSGTIWQVKPWLGLFYSPVWLDYHIIDVDLAYTYMVTSSSQTTGLGKWMYIMTREQVVSDEYLEPLKAAAAKAGWDMSKSERVPQRKRPVTPKATLDVTLDSTSDATPHATPRATPDATPDQLPA